MTDFNECTVVDERSQRLGLPLPHPANSGLVDVMRLREAFDKLDEQVVSWNDTTMLRTPCTDNLTLYVRTDGNDNNDGLSAVTAKKTVQAAVNALANYDGRGNSIVISVGAGIFEASVIKMDAFKGAVNADITIQGSGKGVTMLRSTESRLISNTGCELNICDISLEGYVLSANNGWINITGDVSIKATVAGDYLVQAARGGTVMINPNSLDVAGDAAGLFQSYNGGRIEIYSPTVNFIGNPAFSDAVCKSVVADSAIIWNYVNQWTGTCTGRKYIVDVGSSIYCGSIKPDIFLPGTKDGEIRTNGVVGGQTSGRTSCKSALTLYVRTDGNDNNDGLSATTAKKTVQAAVDALDSYDGRGHNITINVGAGIFESAQIDFRNYKGAVRSDVYLVGAGKGITTLRSTANCILYNAGFHSLILRNVSLEGYVHCAANGLTYIEGDLAIKAVDTNDILFQASRGGSIFINAVSLDVSGNAAGFLYSYHGGRIEVYKPAVKFIGNPVFSDAVCKSIYGDSAIIWKSSNTWTGTCTGKKYTVDSGGSISCHGTNPNSFLPGSINGEILSNGVVGGQTSGRISATTGLTLYVSTTGNDSKDGRSPDTALQSWAGVTRVLRTVDMCGYGVTVSFAPGTYGSWEQYSCFGSHYNRTMLSIRLTSQNAESPAILSGCVTFSGAENTPVTLGNIRVRNSISNTNSYGRSCVVAYHGAVILVEGNVILEGGASAMDLGSGSTVTFTKDANGISTGKLTLAGSFSSGIITTQARFIGYKGVIHFDNPTFTGAAIYSQYGSFVDLSSATFTGFCTGKRYSVASNSAIFTGSAGINFIPGTVAGTADATSFGVYI